MYNPAQEMSSIDFGSIIGGSLNAVVSAQSESAKTTVNFIKSVGFMPGEKDSETGETIGVGAPITVAFSYDKEVSPAQFNIRKTIGVKVENGGAGYDDKSKIHLWFNGRELKGANIVLNSGSISEVTFSQAPNGADIKNDAPLEVKYNGDASAVTQAVLKFTVTEEEQSIPATFQKMSIDVPILTMMPIPFIKIERADIDFNVKINSVSTTNTTETSNKTVDSNTSAGFWAVKTNLKASFSNQKSSSTNEEVKKDYSLNISIHAVQDDMPMGVSRILDILEESIVSKAVSAPSAGQIPEEVHD